MSDVVRAADVAIIGGGVIGCAIAWRLASQGRRVTLVERDEPGHGASWAAGGMIAPLAEVQGQGPFLDLAMASFERYPAWVAALRAETRVELDYQTNGKLQLAFNEAEISMLRERFEWQRRAGFEVEPLRSDGVLEAEPAVSPRARAGLLIARDHNIDNRALGRALWLAAAARGARVIDGVAASDLELEDGRVHGVRLADRTRVASPKVVIAAGAWSGRLSGLPRPLPVEPVRGQMLAIETMPGLLRRVVLTPRCYLIPRRDGRLVVGSTMDDAGFETHVTPRGLRALLDGAVEAVPSLAEAPVVATWAGLRPGTPDGAPILGPDPDVDGLFYATGHFRNGILLAPVTGELIAALVSDLSTPVDWRPFAIDRFEADRAPDQGSLQSRV
ncbi:MAG: glycine oxidase ThiO [Longimicrobiales bacterium]